MKSRIEKYYTGELSDTEMNTLEKEALGDPFLAEAMQGMELVKDPHILSDIELDLPASKMGGSSIWLNGVIGAAVIFGGLFVYQSFISQKPNSKNSINESSGLEMNDEGIEDSRNANSNIQINPAKTVPNDEIVIVQEQKLPEEKFEWNEELNRLEPPAKLEPVATPKEIQVKNTDGQSGKTHLKRLRRSNMAVDYFYDLKVIDYGQIYRTSILVDSSVDSGTPANMETKSDAQGVTITFNSEKWIPYMEYLESTMEHIKNENYTRALIQFEVIFDNFPNDGNAMFYSGLSQYHNKEFEGAIQHLDAIITHDANTFNEEAHWYKLLCLKETRQKTLFDILKQDIIDNKGFYEEKANKIKF